MPDTYINLMGKLLKLIDNGDGTFSMAASTERSVLPSGAATSAKQDAIIDYVDELESKIGEVAELPTTNTIMDRLKAIATNTANIKVDADTINVNTDELESLLTTLSAKDFATQATLAQIKSILDTDGIKKIIDPLPVGSNLIGKIDVNSSALPSGAAKETTLEAVRAALVAGGLPSSTLETTHHDASTANGTGTVANVTGYGPIAFQAVGTWDGATVTYKGSVDGTNYVALPGTSAVTADGIFQPVDPGVAGYKSVRAEITNAGATTSLTVKSLAIAVAKPTSADVVTVGKNAEGASVTGNPLTIGYKNASGNATGVSPTNALPVSLSGSNFTELASDVNIITTKWKQAQEYDIYGIKWDKGATPTLTRTDDAIGLTANAGVGYGSVVNDFDKLPIFGEIEQVEDSLGNVFMKVPKFYCRDTDGTSHKQMQVSKRRYSGFYLPYLFWDFANKKELPYALIGKHKASLGTGNKLESKPNQYPLINKNIVEFRTYANNNNVDGLTGYQQNDIHWVDLLRKLAFIEFATLDIQTVMKGYTEGQFAATHLATVTETGVNRIVVANAHADLYRVGQAISVGTSQGGNQIFYGRTITSIDVYDASNKAITFDGASVDITTGNYLYNTGYKTGFSSQLLASSGSIVANDGKYPCVYRGIESPFGDVWEWVDGLNINDHQAWVCKNAANYASNLFASPYEQLGYVNHNVNGYTKEMGFDSDFPFAQLPTAITGSTTPTQYYGDYYYQDAGQRIALFGGSWNYGSLAGFSCWYLNTSSGGAYFDVGGRLMKKAL